jgi:hypothetical protein
MMFDLFIRKLIAVWITSFQIEGPDFIYCKLFSTSYEIVGAYGSESGDVGLWQQSCVDF